MIRFIVAVSLCIFELAGQFPGSGRETRTLRGRVETDALESEPYGIDLRSISDPMGSHRTYTTATGEFQLQGIPDGDYQLTISDRMGRPILQQLVHADNSGIPVEVRLPSTSTNARPGGTVSVAVLNHKIPRNAQRAFNAAENARKRGDDDSWRKHLQDALAIDPRFFAAHNDLGAYYLDHKLFDRALAELDEAAALDSAAASVEVNRAACLAQMGRLDEAETAARRAVQLNGASPRARYTLGLVLANARKLPGEAVDNLLRASDAFPGARLLAAEILLKNGRASDARQELRQFLKICSGESCKPVQNALDRLNAAR